MTAERREASLPLCAGECGAKCCRNPGYVILTSAEGARLRALDARVRLVPYREQPDYVVMEFARRPCPFLTRENACGIYETRPQACREFPKRPWPGCLVWPAPAKEAPDGCSAA